MVIFDLESDNLLDKVTKIHCVVFKNTKTGAYKKFTPDNLCDLPAFMDKCPELCGHNVIAYDFPVLEKILGYTYKGIKHDSLIMSRVLFPDKQSHSVETYGLEMGVDKVINEDWTEYTEHMLQRCITDVDIQEFIYNKMINHVTELNEKDPRVTHNKMQAVYNMEYRVLEIIEQQANNGFAFDLRLAYELVDKLNDEINEIENQLMPTMPIRVIRVADKETKAFTKDGSVTAIAARWSKDVDLIGGDFSKVQFEPFNLSSSTQLKDYLLSKGWTPESYNFKRNAWGKPEKDKRGRLINTTPKTPSSIEEWERVAEQVNDDKIKLLAMYNKANHRKHQIEGFIKNLRDDHRIEAQATTVGTPTNRMRHRIVVNIPKADPKVYYGKEMRSLFKAEDGKVLVGCDACALEARIESHYIYPFDKEGAKELIEGDVHTKNAEAFGVTRSLAKNGKYALSYGSGKGKLATTLHKSMAEAEKLYNIFWEVNPGLKKLKDLVEAAYDKYGYLLAIDGRPLSIRFKHALINTLFQSAGSIVMKKALVILDDKLKELKLDYKFVINQHDEWQIETNEEDAELIGRLSCRSIEKAGEFYNINVPMLGEYSIGANWSCTH